MDPLEASGDAPFLESHISTVLVVSVEDGLLVQAWSSDDRWPPDDVAPYIADVYKRVNALLVRARSEGALRSIIFEAHDQLILMEEVWRGYTGVFVFPLETPLGLARVSIRRRIPRLQEVIWQLAPEEAPSA